ncbi:MAG: hypothetical protein RhofKO_31180 [Rhodothermales bacterium]
MKPLSAITIAVVLGLTSSACDLSAVIPIDGTETTTELAPAFEAFDATNVTVMLDGDEVVIESNGMPNHTSPYWSEDHPLYIAPEDGARLVPGNIDNFNGSYTLRIPSSPTRATSSSTTTLGPIGIAVSGAMIYNDREGGNQPIDNAVGGLDYSGAHTGPSSYHYHLEPKAWSDDDDALIGVIADGFFLYGRREADGTYPTDLDASGGHVGPTPHNPDGEYHYHIVNEAYLGQYYLLFSGDYQGSPNAIF